MSKEMKRLTRDDTEHGVEYYWADEVDALLAEQPAHRAWVGSGDLEDSNAYLTQPAPQPEQPAPQRKPLNREREIALREGDLADAEKTYFEARADCLNTAQNRKLFEAGFNRGWEAAHGIKGENT